MLFNLRFLPFFIIFLELSLPLYVQAQVVSDDTLGDKQSQVQQQLLGEIDSYRVEEGAKQERNVFHRFTQFSIPKRRERTLIIRGVSRIFLAE
jgi:hypothetical protein